MCDKAKEAGTVERTKDELAELKLENPEYWNLCPSCGARTVRCKCVEVVQVSATEVDAADERFVYIVKYIDTTAGNGIAGVWDDEEIARKRAWEDAKSFCRFPDTDENWPKEAQTYDKEILRIEYGPESEMTVERHVLNPCAAGDGDGDGV